MNNTKLHFFVGISASGKTTKAYEMFGKNSVIIDSDNVRARICPGGATDQSMNARVFEHMYRETCECLSRGVSVCYVATNLSAKRRISFLKNIHQRFPDLECICYIINTPIETCYERNDRRSRTVPEYVIGRQVQSFQVPCEAEGWSRIEVIDNFNEKEKYREDTVMKVMKFGSQQNKHHSLSLFDHCTACGRLAEDMGYGDALQQAAYIHDYGKIHTAVRWPEKDDDLHYLNHSKVGAYLALNMGYSLRVAQLVGAHMYPYTSECEQKVWRVRFGEKLWNDVLKLHELDLGAH